MTDRGQVFLSTMVAGPRERRLTLAFVLLSAGIFLVLAPFAKTPLPAVPAFLPIYQSALVITELVTAVLLLGQFSLLRSRVTLVLASGYLFSASMAVSHAISFPGLFAPTGLLGAGPQTTAWLYFFWHGGFPLFIIAYALFKGQGPEPVTAGGQMRIPNRWAVLSGVAAALSFACALTLLATAGHEALPAIMQGDADAQRKFIVASGTWALILAALAALWRLRPYSVLDLCLMAVMWAWVFDVALAAVLNHGRYDLGWYAGRIYGLMAASFVLAVLLIENGRLYVRLAEAHARERQERRLVQEKTAKLLAVNKELDSLIAALRDSSTRIQSILDTVADGIVTIDERGTVETFNPAAERVFGYAAGEVVGRNVKMLMPEPYCSRHDAYLERYRATGEARIIGIGREVTGRRKDGSVFPLDLSVSEMRLGDEYRYTGVVRDISARKEAERIVVAAKEEAERANAAKDIFLATMSHEIRTPLNGLLGMLELLSLSRLDNEQHESLQIARDSGHGLVRIIDDVLDHAKIEAGKLEIQPEPVSIEQLLRRVLNTYDAVASAKNLTLTRLVDPQISPSLLADSLRVLQILNNLVSNAIKFTAAGGIEVRADLLERACGAESVRLSVQDTGIGVEPEVQQRLFVPFEQAGAVTARLYGGTGLGLSISRRLAEMMDGTLRMESVPGEGTTVSLTLTLPISELAPAEYGKREAVPIISPFATGESPLVLAVDDHSTNRELLARQLAALGLRVRKAADGREAFNLWRSGGFALVVTDCNMPQMDGYALARAIREIEVVEHRPRTPIIAWTANVLPSAVAFCHAAGMDDTLTKPAELAVLKETLSKWLPPSEKPTIEAEGTDAGLGAALIAPMRFAELDKVAATAIERGEILLDFMGQVRSDIAGLRAALSLQDLPLCARIAHRIKGSSRMVGARDLAAACVAMEYAAQQQRAESVGAALTALERELERLEAHIARNNRENEEQP